MAEEISRDPSFVKDPIQNRAIDEPEKIEPVKTKAELDELNPVIQQTRMAQETFGLPSHVVPTEEQMGHVQKQFRNQRVNDIAANSGQEMVQFEEQEGDIPGVKLDPSQVAGLQSEKTPGPANLSGSSSQVKGADPEKLKKIFDMKVEGKTEELGQEATEATMNEVNAILQEEAQDDVDQAFLKDLEDAQAQRNKIANDVMAIGRKFMQGKVDPSRWYANRSTAQKIGIGVSAFLAGFGGSDSVINMVQNAIDRDIDAQKSDFERSKGQIKNMYGMVDKIYGQDVDRAKMVRNIMLESIKNKLAVNMAKAKTSQAQSKLKGAIANIRLEQEKLNEEISLNRFKAVQNMKKQQKVGADQLRQIRLIKGARDAFNDAYRAMENNAFKKFPIGDNKFTASVSRFVPLYLFALSGANVPESEKETVKGWLAQMQDFGAIQKWKMDKMRKLLDGEMALSTAQTMDEVKDILGRPQERSKFFKPSK